MKYNNSDHLLLFTNPTDLPVLGFPSKRSSLNTHTQKKFKNRKDFITNIEPGLVCTLGDEVGWEGVFELFLVLERVVNLQKEVDNV
jgi:hypothetical protein